MTLSIDTVTTPSFLKGQALMTGWMLVAHTCGARTFPLVGAALLDTLAPGWPPDLNPALSGTMLVSGAGVVSVRLCNGTANDVVVPARTFAAAILKSF